ncbi:hypothetical protein I552_6571 [Mycobacterium xenopi 3993]|nr:hypothetical protein I552_6571 [Mycobacterium xenopi 3993]
MPLRAGTVQLIDTKYVGAYELPAPSAVVAAAVWSRPDGYVASG